MNTTKPGAAVAVTSIALGVDMFLYGSIVPILPRLPAVNGSALISGLLFAAYAVALLVATPFVGIWVDRAGPRPAMLAGLVGLAVTTALFAGLAGGSLAVLLIARVAQGIAAAMSWIAGLALIAATHDVSRRGRVMGLALSAVGVGVLLGPGVSGALADAFGTAAPFLVVAVLAAGDAVARMILIKPIEVPENRTPLRTVLSGPNVPLLVLLTAVGAGSIAFLEPILPLHLGTLGLDSTFIGLVFSGGAVVGALGAPLAGLWADKLRPAPTAAIGAVVAAVGFLLAGMGSTLISIAGVLVVDFGAQLILAPTLVLIGVLAEHTSPPAYGAAYALYNLAYTTGLAVAPIAAGTTARLVSVSTATIAAAVVVAVLAAAALAIRGKAHQPQ
ncbi:MFS transporter [Kutzneria chonburiensis]|uniref:MFS transporter n=1 Tax=Kutzneria chonburiensis TaxID=1483604 RepID=A0ABV6MST8_9PSEU|nr:MFS transporter [Kutzneria chonburiensis]